MKLATIPVCLMVVLMMACEDDPMAVLNRARNHIGNKAFIGYRYKVLWPNPVGKIDTLTGTCQFRKNNNEHFVYDYVGKSKSYDLIYIDNTYKEVNHHDSVLFLYSSDDIEKNSSVIVGNIFIMNSPLTLLNNPNWRYLKDTIVHEKALANYSIVEMDTTIDNKKIYVELHLFIDRSEALIETYERRAFLNGKSSQTIIYRFSDYVFGKEAPQLVYDWPSGYTSRMHSRRDKAILLREGTFAPSISREDIDGNLFDLKDLRGRKVLLNFSVINCGYCKLALEHLNKYRDKMPNKIAKVYINPEDDVSDVSDYRQKMPLPFPAIANGKTIAESYGVSAFPTFFLIDELGVIEKVVVGYQAEFVDSLIK